MPKIRYRYTLTTDEREELEAIASKGAHRSQKVLSALILLNCDEAQSGGRSLRDEDIAQVLRVSAMKVHRVKQRFVEEGVEVALNGHPDQRQYSRKADGDFEAHLVALSCSEPPAGQAQWSLRLLADQVVELGYIESISHETVRRVLKKTKSNPGARSVGSSRRTRTPLL